jgi:hypothetical protein
LKRNDLLKQIFTTANVLYHPQIILQGTKAYRDLQQNDRLILNGTTYEGRAAYQVPEVARLAQISGQITNYFFVTVDGVWKGRLQEPANAAALYAEINRVLVEHFEKTLTRLESGKPINDAKAEELVAEAKMKIKAVFDQFPRTELDIMNTRRETC